MQEYNISNGDESEADRLERLLVEEAVARRIEVGVYVIVKTKRAESTFSRDHTSLFRRNSGCFRDEIDHTLKMKTPPIF